MALADHPDAKAVFATLSETSPGVGHDIEAFGKLVAATPDTLAERLGQAYQQLKQAGRL